MYLSYKDRNDIVYNLLYDNNIIEASIDFFNSYAKI